MEPVTHVLTGACLARTGLNRGTAYATIGMAIAAEFPDIDTLWSLRGPVSSFAHHRGITHTFLGLPIEAGLIVLGFYAYDRARSGHRSSVREPRLGAEAPAPRWGVLYLLLLLALLSHILLDYTNNYGVRPLFPFDGRWHAASLVFIFDPVIFLLLVAGLLLPALFGLIGREVGSRPERFRGRGFARAALGGVVLLWAVRYVEHGRAVALAQAQSLRAPGTPDSAGEAGSPTEEAHTDETTQPAPVDTRSLLAPRRSLASPDPLSVFRWYTVTDYGPAYRLGVVDSRVGTLTVGAILTKPQPTPILKAAEASKLGRAYLDWSPMPHLGVSPGSLDDDGGTAGPPNGFRVTFADPRFMGDTTLLHGSGPPPLTGRVFLDEHGHVLAQAMGDHFER